MGSMWLWLSKTDKTEREGSRRHFQTASQAVETGKIKVFRNAGTPWLRSCGDTPVGIGTCHGRKYLFSGQPPDEKVAFDGAVGPQNSRKTSGADDSHSAEGETPLVTANLQVLAESHQSALQHAQSPEPFDEKPPPPLPRRTPFVG